MTDKKSKYMLIEQSIVDKIKRGGYQANEKIESEYELCGIYKASRITVRRALDDLCASNILYRKQGAGTYVQENARHVIGTVDKKQIFVITPFLSRLMSNVAQTYLPEIYENIDNDRYTVNAVMEPAKEEQEQEFIDNIQKQNVAGIIYYYFNRYSVLEKLRQLNIPVVLVDIEPADNPFDFVTGEDFESAYRATLNLINNRCSKIGFFSQYTVGMSTSDLREAGVRQALKDNGIEPEERHFCHCSDSEIKNDTSNYCWILDIAERYLKKNPDLEAVVTANDDSAFSLLGAAQVLKIQIPEQIKVISYGNYSLCNLPSINLTSYEQNLGKYAAEAAKLLVQRIEGDLPGIQQRRTIRYRLIKRGTF